MPLIDQLATPLTPLPTPILGIPVFGIVADLPPDRDDRYENGNGHNYDGRLVWSTPTITEVLSGSAEFEEILASLSAEDRATVRPTEAPHDRTERATDGNGNGYDRAFANYSSGEERTGERIEDYIYYDETGALHHRKVRSSTKKFWQEKWEGGRWVKGAPEVKYLYGLRELLATPASVPVWFTEGEKDRNTLTARGLLAVTNPGGAGKFLVDFTPLQIERWFKGRQKLYLPEDNDEPGRKHAAIIARALQHLVTDIRIIPFRELPPSGDVTDWLEQGHTVAELIARAEAAPRWQRDGFTYVCAADIVPRALDWLWQGHLLRGSLELSTGLPGLGKSQIHCAFAAYTTTTGRWPDGYVGPTGNVVMLTAEDCLDQTLIPRLDAAGANCARVFILKKIRRDNKERMFLLGEDLDELERFIAFVGDVRLVTIDPITAYMGGKLDSHRATDVRGQLGPLADLAERTDIALSAITHPPKHTTQRAIDHFIGSQAFIAAARIGHMTVEEMDEDEHGNRTPTGRGLFANPKNNISRKMPTLAYRINEKQLDGGIRAAYVTWEEVVEITADQAVAAATPSKTKDPSGATVFLLDILANGPAPIKVLEDRAAARGFSKDQLDRAKKKLHVVAFKEKDVKDGRWFWTLPQHAPADLGGT